MFSGLNQRSTEAPHQSEGTGGSFFQEPLRQRAHRFRMMLLLFPLSQQHHSRSKTISQAPWMNCLLCTLRKRCLFPSGTRKPSKNVFFGTVFLTQTFSSKSAWKDITYRSKWISSTSSPAFFLFVVVLPWSKRKKVDTKDRKSRDDRMKLDGGDNCRLSRWRLLIRRVWRLKTIQTTHGTRIPTERLSPSESRSGICHNHRRWVCQSEVPSGCGITAVVNKQQTFQCETVADAPRAKRLRHSSAFINI